MELAFFPTPLSCSPPLQKFLFFVLKSSDVLDILVPILYFLNDARADQCKAGGGASCAGIGWGRSTKRGRSSQSVPPAGSSGLVP